MGIPPQIIAHGAKVAELIPQKAPIVMVDTLYTCDDDRAVTGLTIRGDNMFCENGLFREPGIIEHIAQSAALKSRYEQQTKNMPPTIGYIGSIKNFALYFFPSVGDQLVTTVEVLHVVGDISVLHGKTECNGKTVAECEMKVAEKATNN